MCWGSDAAGLHLPLQFCMMGFDQSKRGKQLLCTRTISLPAVADVCRGGCCVPVPVVPDHHSSHDLAPPDQPFSTLCRCAAAVTTSPRPPAWQSAHPCLHTQASTPQADLPEVVALSTRVCVGSTCGRMRADQEASCRQEAQREVDRLASALESLQQHLKSAECAPLQPLIHHAHMHMRMHTLGWRVV